MVDEWVEGDQVAIRSFAREVGYTRQMSDEVEDTREEAEPAIANRQEDDSAQDAVQHPDDRDLFDNTNIPTDYEREGYKAPGTAEARIAGYGCLVGLVLFAGLLFTMKYMTRRALDVPERDYEARRQVVLREQEKDIKQQAVQPRPVSQLEWTSSIKRALNQDQLVLAFFYANWNQASVDMKEASFENSDVVEEIRKRKIRLVAVRYNASSEVAKRYNVIAVPHTIVLNASGEKLSEYHGLMGARELVDALQRLDSL